ncbi:MULTISPECIES: hypothetical protein [unclassified Marinovum]
MTLAPYRISPLSDYRKHCSQLTGWVEHMGGRLWLTKHGRFVAAVVPFFHCERLEEWERRSLAEERRRLEDNYEKWKRVKAITRETVDVVWEE